MSDLSAAGWRPDPTGRFGQRWFDGNDWTDNVIGANGQPMLDRFPRSGDVSVSVPAAAPPAPSAPAPAPPAAPIGSAWDADLSGPAAPPRASVSTAPASVHAGAWRTQVSMPITAPTVRPIRATAARWPVSIAVAVVGVAAVAVSLLLLDWAPSLSFLDARKAASTFSGSILDTLLRLSLQFGSFAVLALTAVLAGLVVAGNWPRVLRSLAAAASALGAIVHMFTVVRIFRGGGSPEIGAWLGTAGYFVVLIALALDAHRRTEIS